MTAQHTPGPWRIVRYQRGKYRGDFGIAPRHELDPVFCFLCKGREDIQQANARLIAAAPVQHEALLAFVAAYESWRKFSGEWARHAADDPLGQAFAKAQAAIAEATQP